jgi:hypothetical protein
VEDKYFETLKCSRKNVWHVIIHGADASTSNMMKYTVRQGNLTAPKLV